LYAQFLSRTFVSVESIKNYISGVKTLHFCLGFNIDHINSYLLNLSFKGLQRLKPRSVKQAEPITLSILLKIHEQLDFSIQDNIVYWCLFLFAFFLVARKSNLVPTSSADVLKGRFLSTESIRYFHDYILVHFNWSKTIQFGEREVVSPLLRLKDKRLCPVVAYEKLLSLNLDYHHNVLFTLTNGSYISYYLFQKKLRECISLIGLSPESFSTHSFRRGFATLAHRSNIPPEHIQLLGDWKSDAYKSYLELNWSDKAHILTKMFDVL
jgi:integrase